MKIRLKQVLVSHENGDFGTSEDLQKGIHRVYGVLVIKNLFLVDANKPVQEFYHLGSEIAALLMPDLMRAVGVPPSSYGKAALVGASGSQEHGAVLLHPTLGQPVRQAIGGGKALMPSNVKVAQPGEAIDVPLGHKDDAWSFNHMDTMTVSVAGAPRTDEIAVIIALGAGTRINI